MNCQFGEMIKTYRQYVINAHIIKRDVLTKKDEEMMSDELKCQIKVCDLSKEVGDFATKYGSRKGFI